MSVSIDLREFEHAFADLEAGIHNGAHQALVASVKTAHEAAASTTLFNDRTGRLRSSITSGVPEPLSGFIRAGAKYARFVNDGTAPHVIQARRGSLRFVTSDGRTVFRRSVQHPGTARRPFMNIAADRGEQTLDYGLDYFTEKPIAHFNVG